MEVPQNILLALVPLFSKPRTSHMLQCRRKQLLCYFFPFKIPSIHSYFICEICNCKSQGPRIKPVKKFPILHVLCFPFHSKCVRSNGHCIIADIIPICSALEQSVIKWPEKSINTSAFVLSEILLPAFFKTNYIMPHRNSFIQTYIYFHNSWKQ